MSFTFTKEGIEMQILLNNKNWDILHRIFHNFCFYRGWYFSGSDEKYINLFSSLKDEFLANRALFEGELFKNKINNDNEFWVNYFVEFLKNNNVRVTELDIKRIKKAV